MTVMKVKSTHPASQGPFVLIEERDYDPAVHKPYQEELPKARAVPPAAAAVKPVTPAKG